MTFLQEMNAAAISRSLGAIDLIPERLVHVITPSTNREDCNAELLAFLMDDASKEQILGVFRVAFECKGYGRMNSFAAGILQHLQQG